MTTRRKLLIGSLPLLSAGLGCVSAGRAQSVPGLAALLQPLMTRERVPGASAALIRDGEIVERVAIGAGQGTLFQAASISKMVAGLVVLRLAERGEIGLDRPVNEQLHSWVLPGERSDEVTPRLLLAHRGGTTVSGFPGYAPGTPLPDLKQILDGTPPANTGPVRQVWAPGEAFRYSGGGTMVLQQLVEDVAGRPFTTVAAELVLMPCGMVGSTFRQPPATTDVAVAHDAAGQALPGGFRLYPEAAAAGLWSTAPELALMALSIAASWKGLGLLAQTTALAMARPVDDGPTGLGVFVQPRGRRPPRLYHEGVNAGFRSILAFDADAAFGVALMTNGEGGRALLPAFLEALFAAYGQDPFRPA